MRLLRLLLLLPVMWSCLSGAELKGYISDAACGWAPVFVRDGGMDIYKIADKSKAMPFVGDHVSITGAVRKDSVTIRSVRKLAK